MSLQLLRPARVYFDTANLQDIATAPQVDPIRALFATGIAEGRFVPVLSFVHCIEIAKKPPHLREAFVGLLGGPVARKQVMWARSARPIMDNEWIRAGANRGDGRLPPDEVFSSDVRQSLLAGETMIRRGEEYPGFGAQVEALVPHASGKYLEVASGWADAMKGLRDRRRGGSGTVPAYTTQHKVAMAVSGMPEEFRASETDAADGGFQVRLELMPAHRLVGAYEEGTVRSAAQIRDTDTEDRWHLPCAAYADTVFVDASTYERLRVGGAVSEKFKRNSALGEYLRHVEPLATQSPA